MFRDVVENQKGEREATLLAEASKVFSSSLEIKEIFNKIAKLVSEEVGETCEIFKVGEKHLLPITAFSKGEEDKNRFRILTDEPIPLQGSITGFCVENKEPVLIADTARDQSFVRFYSQLLNVRSYICVPLIARGGVLGALVTSITSGGRRLDKNHLRLVVVMADHAAAALENSKLYEKVREQVRWLSVVNEVCKAVNSTLDMDSVYKMMVEQLKRVLPFKFSMNIALYNPKDDTFLFSHLYDSTGALQSLIQVNQPYSSGSLVLTEALRTKSTCYVQDARKLPFEMKFRKQLIDKDILSFLNLPLIVEQECIGTLNVGAFHVQAFREDQIVLLETISSHLAIAINNAKLYEELQSEKDERKHTEEELQHSLGKLRKALGGVIRAIALTVEAKDPYTAGHQQRVSNLARAIAQEMGLSREQVDGLRMAAVIHDLGKVKVPSEILSKPGALSEAEFDLVKAHPQVGYDILKDIEFPWPVAQIVLQHQERMDGSGYPSGLSGEHILIEARVLAVADVVEAVASHRPYRPSLGLDKALEEISQNRGALFDPDAVDACLKLFTEKGFNL